MHDEQQRPTLRLVRGGQEYEVAPDEANEFIKALDERAQAELQSAPRDSGLLMPIRASRPMTLQGQMFYALLHQCRLPFVQALVEWFRSGGMQGAVPWPESENEMTVLAAFVKMLKKRGGRANRIEVSTAAFRAPVS